MTTMLDLLKKGAVINQKIHNRISEVKLMDPKSRTVGDTTTWTSKGGAKDKEYAIKIKLVHRKKAAEIELDCECINWRTNRGVQDGTKNTQPCKHILALAKDATIPTYVHLDLSKKIPVSSISKPTIPTMTPTPHEQSFSELVSAQIHQAIETLSFEIEAILLAGGVPLVIGPTGSGKTSAHRMIALRQSWRLVEQAGAASYSDADLVGIVHVNGVPFPGPVADAFGAARLLGETALLFLDEFTRFNARAQEALMRPLLPIAADAAQAMGVETDVAVRITSAPFWGTEWAPAEKVQMSLACNPWGTPLDPALIRRTQPIFANFPAAVADVFDKPVATAIKATWSAVSEGRWPLPIEYQALAQAAGPDDTHIFAAYTNKLRALDPAAAEGFAATLQGLGL